MALGASGHDIDLSALAPNAVATSSGGVKRCEYFLAEWSATETAELENELAVQLATMGQETQNLTFEAMGRLVSQSAELFRSKDFIRDEPMSAEKIDWFKDLNSKGKNRQKPFTWVGRAVMKGMIKGQLTYGPPVEDSTYPGYGDGQATQEQVAEVLDAIPICEVGQVQYIKSITPIMKQADIVRMWACAKFCFEAVSLVDGMD